MSTKTRDEKVELYIKSKLDKAEKQTLNDFRVLENFDHIYKVLDDLIPVKAQGFRGVVATAIAGMYWDPSYDPLNQFYQCKPRALFEGPIYNVFSGRIPCGKSDPLNVAKNAYVLDESWAAGKKPAWAALAAVEFLKLLKKSPQAEKETLIDFFFFELVQYAKSVKNYPVEVPKSNELSNIQIANNLIKFCLEFPESGTIPQKVIAILLEAAFSTQESTVQGANESVFGTNTTSKKPADIWIETAGEVGTLYEITVKGVNKKRLDDALQHVINLKLSTLPLVFICRIPEDIKSLEGVQLESESATLIHRGKTVDFIDIGAFIRSICTILSKEALQAAVENLAQFIGAIDRPTTTKRGWNSIF